MTSANLQMIIGEVLSGTSAITEDGTRLDITDNGEGSLECTYLMSKSSSHMHP